MASKLVKLSFPEEDSDVYNLLKSKARPSKFVAEAIRFYQLNKGKKQSLSEKDIQALVDEKVSSLISVELKKINQRISQEVEKQVKSQLKNVKIVAESSSDETPTVYEPHEVGAINLEAMEDTSSVDFSKAIGMFDDDD